MVCGTTYHNKDSLAWSYPISPFTDVIPPTNFVHFVRGPVQSATFRMKGARVFQARFSLGAYDRFPQQVKVESVGAEVAPGFYQ